MRKLKYLAMGVVSIAILSGCTTKYQVSQPKDNKEAIKSVGTEIYIYEAFMGVRYLKVIKPISLDYEGKKIPLQVGDKLNNSQNNTYCITKQDATKKDLYNTNSKDTSFNVCTNLSEDEIYQSDTFKVEYESLDAQSFKYELLYQGVQDKVLRLTYREFVGSFARPAFFQELTYNLDDKKSTIIKFKNLDIEILEANNNSIKYKILKSN